MKAFNVVFFASFIAVFSFKVTDANPLSRYNIIPRAVEDGRTAVENFSAYPYLVSIQIVSDTDETMHGHMCGGAVIGVSRVITSAICVVLRLSGSWQPLEPATFRVFTASTLLSEVTDATTRLLTAIVVHPSFDANTLSNNIAILEVATPFVIGVGGVIPVILGDVTPSVGTDCTLVGWTDITEDNPDSNIRAIASTVADSQECSRIVGTFTAERFCAVNDVGVAPCPGDLGGPLICGSQLHGLLSSGLHCDELASQPSVYTRIQPSLAWIKEQLAVPGNSATITPLHYALVLLALTILVY